MQAWLIWIARQCRGRGWRLASVALLELASVVSGPQSVARQLVIDLLAVGDRRRARQTLLAARSNPRDLASFEGQDKRFLAYIDWDGFRNQIQRDLDDSRQRLVSFLSGSSLWYQPLPCDFSGLTDFILISNARIALSRHDVERLRGMKAPVFVFLNHANPGFQKLLLQKGLQHIPHLLMAGKNGLVNQDLRLIYKSHGIYPFKLLGCLVRNGFNPHFRKYFLEDVKRANQDVFLVCIDDVAEQVDSIFREHAFLSAEGKAPIPSLGWLAVEFFSALAVTGSHVDHGDTGDRPSIWLAGFDLSPSYVFESNFKVEIHDFVYEYAALNIRFASGSVNRLGRPDHCRYQRQPPRDRLTNKQMWALRGPDSRPKP